MRRSFPSASDEVIPSLIDSAQRICIQICATTSRAIPPTQCRSRAHAPP